MALPLFEVMLTRSSRPGGTVVHSRGLLNLIRTSARRHAKRRHERSAKRIRKIFTDIR